jgi:carboxyl-terminal processing protease
VSLAGVVGAVPFGLEFVGRPEAQAMLSLLRAEKAEFEAVLGTSVEIVADASLYHQRWIIRDRGHDEEAPTLGWDPARRELTSFADSAAEFATTLNLLHTLAWSQQTRATNTPLTDSVLAVDRVYTEVANTYPAFALRGLDWDQITQRHAHLVELHGEEFLLGVQRWIAELGDAHTSARRPTRRFHPPYRARMTPAGAELTRVPCGSAAHEAPVRTGWIIDVADPARWLTTSGATPQQHAQVAARNFMSMTEPQREFTARDCHGNRARWNETTIAPTLHDTLRWWHLDQHRTYIQLDSFDGSLDLAAGFDTLLTEARTRHSQMLILDLRGNAGGALTSATALRDRFLRTHTQLGSIAFTTGTGQLANPVPLIGDPSPSTRWTGPITVLVDPMTYSAAEDFLLGLQGLEHVTVLGEPTGGGSGRPRTITITPELVLSISTALTYDRHHRCIEFNGLPVDGPATTFAR